MATAMANTMVGQDQQQQQQQQQQGPIFVDTQHDDMVHDAQLDYYGCKLATSSSGRNGSGLMISVFKIGHPMIF